MRALGVLASNRFVASAPVQDHPGKVYLEANAKMFYDFTRLSGADDTFVVNGDSGLDDFSPGNAVATIVGTPVVEQETVSSFPTKTVLVSGQQALSTGSDLVGITDEDFIFYYTFKIADGISGANQWLYGVTSSAGTTIFNVVLNSAGRLLVRYRTPTADSRWDSTAALLPDGITGPHSLKIKYDFTNDVFGVWLNGNPVDGSFTSGSMAALDPSTWANTLPFYLGTNNAQGTPTSNSTSVSIFRAAFTNILSGQDEADVDEYMNTFGQGAPTGSVPTIQASNLVVSVGEDTAVLSWVGGNGTNKLVLLVEDSTGVFPTLPTNGVSYTPDPAFGSGSELSTGVFAVFGGVQNTVTVTNLVRDTPYHAIVCEFDSNGNFYNIQQGTNVIEFRTDYINDQSFANYATDYTENVVGGFTSNVVGGELILDGEPLGFEDWVSHDEWIASLEDFEIEIGLRINGAPGTGTPGIGIGIKNDVSTEANRGVVCLFVTDTDSPNYGRVQLYAGDGTINANGYAFRTQSSGAFAPVLDSQYKVVFRREVIGNDASYTATVTDLLDPQQNFVGTAPFIETGRPSSAFFATTIRSWIYQNGGDHAIDYFIVRRIGNETSPTPEPEVFDVYVTINGSDANDGLSISTPKRTVIAGLAAVEALGGAVGSKTLSVGPGTYTEAQLVPPNNLLRIQGASKETTIIQAHSSLFSFTNRSSMSGALVSIQGSTPVTLDMEFRSLTFDGMRGAPLDPNSCKLGFAISKRNGVKLTDITIRNFNTCGLRLADVDTFTIDDFLIENASGNDGINTFYMIETASTTQGGVGGCGGSTLLSSDVPDVSDSFNIQFLNGAVRGLQENEGSGWGLRGGLGNNRYIHNVLVRNVTFQITGVSQDDTGHHFNLEWLDYNHGHILFDNVRFDRNISFGMTGLAQTDGYMRFTKCTWDIVSPTTLVVEMQISKIVIDNCFIRNARNGVFTSLNNQNTYKGGEAGGSPFAQDHGDWHIHHNILQLDTAGGYGIFGGLTWDTDDQIFEHNTIRFRTTSGGTWFGNVVSNQSGHSVSGLVIQDNVYIGQPPSTSNMWDTGAISGGICRNNYASHFNVNASRAGVTNTSPAPLGSVAALGLVGGAEPTTWDEAFNGNYYRPSSTSPLKGAAHDASDVGALAAL